MKTVSNTYSGKFAASQKRGQRTGHGNPSGAHASRGSSTVKHPKSSGKGKMGLSIGQKVPMNIFQSDYKKPDYHGAAQMVDANIVKRKTKKALGGKQKKFFGL